MGEIRRRCEKTPTDRFAIDARGRAPQWPAEGRCGTRLAHVITMSHIITRRRVLGVLEHTLAIVMGIVLMVLGLGLSVTMIMLPVGLVVGLAGLAMFIAGTCVHFDWI
jgi:hypothetical protein